MVVVCQVNWRIALKKILACANYIWLRVTPPVVHLLYAVSFFGNSPVAGRGKSLFLIGTLAAHFAYIILRTVAFDHPPITTVFEIT